MSDNKHEYFPFCCKECSDFIDKLFYIFVKNADKKTSLEVIQDDFLTYKKVTACNLELVFESQKTLIQGLNSEIAEEAEKKYSLISILMFIYYIKMVFGKKEYLNSENEIIRFLNMNSLELNIQCGTFGADNALLLIKRLYNDIIDFMSINY